MNPAIFRAYDVRGIAATDLEDPFVMNLGRAYGTTIIRNGGTTVTLGRDCRTHGPRLRAAFVTGLLETGLRVIDVGIVGSPLLYFSVFHHDADGGVQITGSHNPRAYNGFKMMIGKESLHGDAIQQLRRLIEAKDFERGQGKLESEPILNAYVEDVVGRIKLGHRPVRVVVDGGNGTGGPPAVQILREIGVEVIPLFIEMDGTFPNHHPDPTVEANLATLKASVSVNRASLGVAYDGDADRIGVVDENGRVIWGDRLMILLSREVLSRHPGATIVGEVKCSQTLYDDIVRHGGTAIMSAVGHSIIKTRMKKEGAQLAGEMSGHIFYQDRWYGFDDAIYVTCRLLEILSRSDQTLSELLADVPETCVTPEIRLDCPDAQKFQVVAEAVAHFKAEHDVVDIDGARITFGSGWGLIRASNTQPVIVLRAEAEDEAALAAIRGTLEGFVAARVAV